MRLIHLNLLTFYLPNLITTLSTHVFMNLVKVLQFLWFGFTLVFDSNVQASKIYKNIYGSFKYLT